ncbi:hypothetical protein [Streptomyces sp. NPDC047043]
MIIGWSWQSAAWAGSLVAAAALLALGVEGLSGLLWSGPGC